MAIEIQDFVGQYTIRYGSGNFDQIQVGYELYIGTGLHDDMQSDGIRVGVSIVDPSTGTRVLPVGNNTAFAYLVDGTLNGSTFFDADPSSGEGPQLLTYQVSLLQLRTRYNQLVKAPSIMVMSDDPRNAGVWGADDQGG
ncbi:MAG: hypothetical protein MI919_24645 [Holophagales bacterium]|nr:hypothetical protein [Holophagales bacterium]